MEIQKIILSVYLMKEIENVLPCYIKLLLSLLSLGELERAVQTVDFFCSSPLVQRQVLSKLSLQPQICAKENLNNK